RACGASTGPFDATPHGIYPSGIDDRDRHTSGAAHHRYDESRSLVGLGWPMTPPRFARSLLSPVARLLHDNHGASATIVAIVLPGLIALGALGAETGVWFTIKLRNQAAADAAVIAAAYEVIAGKTSVISDLTPAASEAALRNGFKGSALKVVYPYSDSVVNS